MKNMKKDNIYITGYEIHSFIKNKIYIKERFLYQYPLECRSFYIILKDDCAIIMEGVKPRKNNKDIVLEKVFLEKGDAISVISEQWKSN